jgi:hypothetical protein
MPSPWGAVDRLLRELGSLRNDARALDPALGRDVQAEVDRLIGAAAQAVDETMSGPDVESVLVAACEAIVVARDRMASLSATISRSREVVGRSVALRRESARLLEQIRGGAGERGIGARLSRSV